MVDTSIIVASPEPGKTGPALSATSDMPLFAEATQTAKVEEGKTDTVVETSKETATETVVEAAEKPGETVEEVVTDKPSKPPKKDGITERFSEITAQRKAAEKRADDLAASLDKALAAVETLTKAKAEPAKVEEADPRPKREAFDNPDAYDEALIEWTSKTTAKTVRAEIEKDRLQAEEKATKDTAEERQRQANEATVKSYADRVKKVTEEFPDYAEVVDREDLQISVPMAHTILNIYNGPALAYHLGKNPEEASRIFAMVIPGQFYPQGHPQAGQPVPDAQRQVFALGQVAASLTKPKVAVSQTPAPIKPVGARQAAVEKSPDEMTMDEYGAWRQPQIEASRRSGRSH